MDRHSEISQCPNGTRKRERVCVRVERSRDSAYFLGRFSEVVLRYAIVITFMSTKRLDVYDRVAAYLRLSQISSDSIVYIKSLRAHESNNDSITQDNLAKSAKKVCRISTPFYSDTDSFSLAGSIGTLRNFRVPIHPRNVLPS